MIDPQGLTAFASPATVLTFPSPASSAAASTRRFATRLIGAAHEQRLAPERATGSRGWPLLHARAVNARSRPPCRGPVRAHARVPRYASLATVVARREVRDLHPLGRLRGAGLRAPRPPRPRLRRVVLGYAAD